MELSEEPSLSSCGARAQRHWYEAMKTTIHSSATPGLMTTFSWRRIEAVTLRLSMLAILGPKSINEKKFTDWTTSARALGLDWDTERRTVSMPPDKITKALGRVQELLRAHRASRTGLSCLLGLRRHVCSCIRSARPFFRRLAALHRRAPLWGTLQLSQGGVLDLLWFEHILRYGRLEGIPLRFFEALPEPVVHFYIDASNQGLSALHLARKTFLRVRFDREERALIR
jgi:hypothetical protein